MLKVCVAAEQESTNTNKRGATVSCGSICAERIVALPTAENQVTGFPICGQGALKDVSHDARQVPITSVAKGNARGHDSQSLDLGPDA